MHIGRAKKKAGTEKRKFIRLDSVFPVEFQLLSPGISEENSPWHQGFTSNISKGGIGLNAPGLDAKTLELLQSKSVSLLKLKIHIPILQPPIFATAVVAWIGQEKEGSLGPYAIGLRYEEISEKDSQRIMRFVSFKVLLPRFAFIAAIILFLGLGASAYYNFKLFSYNQKLIEVMVETVRDFSTTQAELEGVRKEKGSLEKQLVEAKENIKAMIKDLDEKVVSLEKDLSLSEEKKSAEIKTREEEIQKLRAKIFELEEDKESLSQRIGELQKKEGAVSLKLEEIGEKKTILEKVNFDKMYQWLKIHQNSRTGLLASFEGDKRLEDQAFTYDQALAAIAFTYFKDYELAKKTFNFYATKAKYDQGYYNGYYASSGEPAEFIVHNGPNLWLGIAILQYTHYSGDRRYLPLAERIADWVIRLQKLDSENGLKGGPGISWFSTEHNLDAFAFFNMFYQLSQKPAYKKSAEQLLKWLKEHSYDNPEIPVKRGKGDATIATDTYAWSIASLGPDRLTDIGMSPEGIINFAEESCAVTVNYDRPAGQRISVKGFDFAKDCHLARGGVISTEWTAQMVLSFKILSRYFASKLDAINEKKYKDKADEYLGELTKLVISSPSRTGQGQGCLPYASVDFVDTGHGWMTPKGKNTGSVSATAYAIFAYYGFNPLELNNTN